VDVPQIRPRDALSVACNQSMGSKLSARRAGIATQRAWGRGRSMVYAVEFVFLEDDETDDEMMLTPHVSVSYNVISQDDKWLRRMSVPVAAHGSPYRVGKRGRESEFAVFFLNEMRTQGLQPSRMNPSVRFCPPKPSESDRHFGCRWIASRYRNGGRMIGGGGLSTFCR
jgi:hypothetical protein